MTGGGDAAPAATRTAVLLDALAGALPRERLLDEPSERWAYGYDNSGRQTLPALVVMAAEVDDVVAAVSACARLGVPVTVRGRGTGTAGGAVPDTDGLVISLEGMNRILAVDPDNRVAVVEAGVTNADVQRAAGEHGFFWPPDPTSAEYCTVGGNLACNAAGPRAVKYGTPRENTLGLSAVTGTGEVIRTGCYTTKGVVGYDLTRLLIGSEGTLAVITEATLKLTPQPEAVATLRAVYADMDAAARAVSRLMAQPEVPRTLEFMDGQAIALVRDYGGADLPRDAGALLIIEADGPAGGLAGAVAALEAAAGNDGLRDIRAAVEPEEIRALWASRKALSPALRRVAPKKINEDVVVPVSRMAELVARLEDIAARRHIRIVSFGHAGNGNLHVNLLGDPADERQARGLERGLADVFDAVLAMGGTLSGEHGIGWEKRDYVGLEIEPATLALMRGIKGRFDPAGILNPGKAFPDPAPPSPT